MQICMVHSYDRVRKGRPRSSKVVNFGTNQKPLCDFLVVVDRALDISYIVSEIRQLYFSAPNRNFSIPLSFNTFVWGEHFRISVWNLSGKNKDPGAVDSEDFMILACVVLTQYRRVTVWQRDRQTDGQRHIPMIAMPITSGILLSLRLRLVSCGLVLSSHLGHLGLLDLMLGRPSVASVPYTNSINTAVRFTPITTATSIHEQMESQADNVALASNASCRIERPRTVSVSLVKESLTISVVTGAKRGPTLPQPVRDSIQRFARVR